MKKKESFRRFQCRKRIYRILQARIALKKFWHAGGSDDYRRISDRRRLIYHRIQCCWKPRSRGDFCNFTRPFGEHLSCAAVRRNGAALPYAGGTYQFASLGLGKAVGVLAGWNFIISLVAVTGGEALAFSYYFKTLCLAFGWQIPLSNVAVALIVTIGFIIANVFGVRLTGRLQNGFMFFFWGVAAIWFLTMIPNIELPNFVKSPEFIAKDKDFTFIGAVCMIWWCFAGFEACVAMGEEIRFPKINIPRAMFLAPFVVFCVNALFQWYLIGITPVEKLASLATAEAPYAEAMKAAGIFGFPLALLAAGIAFGGDFSTLNASISTTPRYLFTMARDGAMPKIFAKVSRRYQTPYVAVITLGVLTVALIATNSLLYIAELSLFADLFYYVLGILAALGLRKNHPELKRSYKAPLIMIGAAYQRINLLVYDDRA